MKNILFGFILIVSCNSEKPKSFDLEARVKKYMSDTVIQRFHDPASYQFVSMKVDTFTGRKYYNNIARTLSGDSSVYPENTFDEYRKQMAEMKSIEGYMDSILHLPVTVEYRGKNKMGALVLNSMRLRYYPNIDKFQQVE